VLALSGLSWRFVEQPFRHPPAGSATTPRWQPRLLSATLAALIALSLCGYLSNLPLLRFDPADRRLLEVGRIDADRYQRVIAKPFERRAFVTGGTAPKVAFIGDSYARDFLNVLNEAGILSHLDASLWTIAHDCAPFYLPPPEDEQLREVWQQAECRPYDRYRSPEMMTAVTSADVVVLTSRWELWQVPHVRQTVQNLRATTKAAIVLVGPKGFGEPSVRNLLRLPAADRPAFRSPIDPQLVAANNAMSQIRDVHYIDVVRFLCDDDGRCPQVDGDGRLISQDGNHFTPAGAVLFGTALAREAGFSSLFTPAR